MAAYMARQAREHGTRVVFVGLADGITEYEPGAPTVVRAIEEAAAFVAASHLRILDEVTADAASASGEITFTGGSSAGVLWPRVIAGATGRTTRTTEAPEATSYGAARLAGTAVGIDLPALPLDPTAIAPQEAERAAYRDAARRWREVYDAQRTATVRSGATALFTAGDNVLFANTLTGPVIIDRGELQLTGFGGALASASPTTLACMHGSAWQGDGAALLRHLGEALLAR